MDEQKLKEVFDRMGPDDEARQRMLKNILAAHGAQADESTQEQKQASVRTPVQGQTDAQNESSLQSQTRVQDETTVQNKTRFAKRRTREFSLLRYALPFAACLLFAALVPSALPQLATYVEENLSPATVSEQEGTLPYNPSADTSVLSGANQELPSESSGVAGLSGSSTPSESSETPEPSTASEASGASDSSGASESSEASGASEPASPQTSPDASSTLTSPPSEATATMPPQASEEDVPTVPIYSSADVPFLVPPPPEPSFIDRASFILCAAACLAALIFALRGFLVWRRAKRTVSTSQKRSKK